MISNSLALSAMHILQGYNRGMLQELKETTNGSAERQLYVLMYRLLQKNEIENKSVVTRIEEIMKGVCNSAIFFIHILIIYHFYSVRCRFN